MLLHLSEKLRRFLANSSTARRINANTVPIAVWALMEVIQDRALWKSAQEEAEPAFEISPATDERTLNVQKMMALPLLQSIYSETLRLHVSVNAACKVVADTATIAGYKLPKQSLIQAPTRVAHHNKKTWGEAEHPASKFWAYRHIKYQRSGLE